MISIRPAQPADRLRLFAIVTEVGNFRDEEIVVAREVIDDALDPAKHDYTILVAVDSGDRTMGFICYGPIPLTENRWDLYWIAVDPAAARRGIGSLLLAAMEERLADHGAHIYIDTSSTPSYQAARGFYEHHGYRQACILPDFYRQGDDKIVYKKKLAHVPYSPRL